MSSSQTPEQSETFQKLLRETGKIEWRRLAAHYEGGSLVVVDPSLDLVRVAYSFARDEQASVAQWLENGLVSRVEAAQVNCWNQEDPQFWAVVVAPWVLIQPVCKNPQGPKRKHRKER